VCKCKRGPEIDLNRIESILPESIYSINMLLENNNSHGNCSGDDDLKDVHLNNDNNEDEMHMDTTDNQQLVNEPTMVDASC